MTLRLMSLLSLAACGGSVTVGDDTDTDAPTVPDTSEPIDSPDPGDTDVGLAVLPCHAWDPMDVSGGKRTYDLTTSTGTVSEVHTLGATIELPSAPSDGFGVHVVSGGDNPTDVVTINACRDGDTPGALEIAFDGVVGDLDMVGLTQTGLKYLPPAETLDNRRRPTWSSSTLWALDVDVSVPSCPEPLLLKRTTAAEYAVRGRETLDVPGIGKVEAVRVEVVQAERVDTRGDVSTTCRTALERFEVIGPATRTDVRAHRWYVRGVGLVLGMIVDPDEAACIDPVGGVVPQGCTPALTRRLTSCEGLAGCP